MPTSAAAAGSWPQLEGRGSEVYPLAGRGAAARIPVADVQSAVWWAG